MQSLSVSVPEEENIPVAAGAGGRKGRLQTRALLVLAAVGLRGLVPFPTILTGEKEEEERERERGKKWRRLEEQCEGGRRVGAKRGKEGKKPRLFLVPRGNERYMCCC